MWLCQQHRHLIEDWNNSTSTTSAEFINKGRKIAESE